MFNYEDFKGSFGDFMTLFGDVDLDKYVVRFYYNGDTIDGEAYHKIIIGITELSNDILLHLIEPGDTPEETADNAKEYGIEFRLLSEIIGKHGFEIKPCDQYDDEDDEI